MYSARLTLRSLRHHTRRRRSLRSGNRSDGICQAHFVADSGNDSDPERVFLRNLALIGSSAVFASKNTAGARSGRKISTSESREARPWVRRFAAAVFVLGLLAVVLPAQGRFAVYTIGAIVVVLAS